MSQPNFGIISNQPNLDTSFRSAVWPSAISERTPLVQDTDDDLQESVANISTMNAFQENTSEGHCNLDIVNKDPEHQILFENTLTETQVSSHQFYDEFPNIAVDAWTRNGFYHTEYTECNKLLLEHDDNSSDLKISQESDRGNSHLQKGHLDLEIHRQEDLYKFGNGFETSHVNSLPGGLGFSTYPFTAVTQGDANSAERGNTGRIMSFDSKQNRKMAPETIDSPRQPLRPDLMTTHYNSFLDTRRPQSPIYGPGPLIYVGGGLYTGPEKPVQAYKTDYLTADLKSDRHEVEVRSFSDIVRRESEAVTMSLKQIMATIDMASMQSPRTQCCCCAVGVFAAMFGIFMLSAGICIVLNVTFMEVDTSGLPPELHNENGKKVVGIILICVAIAALGLSATVSVVYFALCNQKPRTSAATVNGSQQQKHAHGTNGNTHLNSNQRISNLAPPGGSRSHHDRPKSRDSQRSVSQTSIRTTPRSRRTSPPSGSIDGVPFSKSMSSHSHGRLPSSKSRKHHQPHQFRYNKHRARLDTHIEEDSEVSKPGMEMLTNQKSADTSSNSGSSMAPSQQTSFGTEEQAAGIAKVGLPKTTSTPTVVIGPYQEMTSTPMSTISSADYAIENEFMDFIEHYDHEYPEGSSEEAKSSQLISTHDSGLHDNMSTLQSTNFSLPGGEFKEDHDLDLPPCLPYNIEVVEDHSSKDCTSSTTSESAQNLTHNLVKVKPPEGGDADSPRSSSTTLLDLHKPNLEEEKDNVADLPSKLKTLQTNVSHRDDPGDLRSESRSSFNSAFSNDGDDPSLSEMEQVQKRMEEILYNDGKEV